MRQRFTRAVAALAGIAVALIGGTLFGSRANRLLPGGFRSPSETFANWVEPKPDFDELWMGVMVCPPPPMVSGGIVTPQLEPAETPLPPPTEAQLEAIVERLAQWGGLCPPPRISHNGRICWAKPALHLFKLAPPRGR